MKPITDRVILNPFTSLIGIAFACVGVWILKWSDDLSEASRVLLSILCFVISITGLGWSDKAFFKVLDYFKKRANILLIFSFSIALLGGAGCVSNRTLLRELNALKISIAQINNSNQIIYYENEKRTIDTDFESMPDHELIRAVDELAPPSSKPKSKNKP